MSKKPWHEPQLIVLVKGTSQEAVLDTCKGPVGADGPSKIDNSTCDCQTCICLGCDQIEFS
jgi:hypothetical protein